MTEHLPECPYEPPVDNFCICNLLRSCEIRALDAAIEAVAAINGKWIFGPRIYKHQAIHAIRLLRKGDQP